MTNGISISDLSIGDKVWCDDDDTKHPGTIKDINYIVRTVFLQYPTLGGIDFTVEFRQIVKHQHQSGEAQQTPVVGNVPSTSPRPSVNMAIPKPNLGPGIVVTWDRARARSFDANRLFVVLNWTKGHQGKKVNIAPLNGPVTSAGEPSHTGYSSVLVSAVHVVKFNQPLVKMTGGN